MNLTFAKAAAPTVGGVQAQKLTQSALDQVVAIRGRCGRSMIIEEVIGRRVD
jgi:hypothetical protein